MLLAYFPSRPPFSQLFAFYTTVGYQAIHTGLPLPCHTLEYQENYYVRSTSSSHAKTIHENWGGEIRQISIVLQTHYRVHKTMENTHSHQVEKNKRGTGEVVQLELALHTTDLCASNLASIPDSHMVP